MFSREKLLFRPFYFFIITIFLLCPFTVLAQEEKTRGLKTDSSSTFAECVIHLKKTATAQGISPALAEKTLDQVSYLPSIIEFDRRQPEFTVTFAEYLDRRVTKARIEEGRTLLEKHRDLLNRIVGTYGVPAQYLLAFWGLESNYGNYQGKIPTLDALTTLACDQRRSSFFTTELLNALRLLEKHQVKQPLLGSWAGAMGHTQFMPSAYLRYGVDGDGDGKVDLWNSVPDALTSAANFLQNLGWKSGYRWGREVRLPEDFAFETLGLENKQSFEKWRSTDLRDSENISLPAIRQGKQLQAALLVPSGYQGPAFLVYGNFEVMMRWNRSEFYALAVGHLADRIKGLGPLAQSPPANQPRLSTDQVIELQEKLFSLGYDPGVADGVLGPATRRAIRDFQLSTKMKPDGYPSKEVITSLKKMSIEP